jgi:hypothetical protein
MKNHHVVVLAYDQLCTFEFGCVVEVCLGSVDPN